MRILQIRGVSEVNRGVLHYTLVIHCRRDIIADGALHEIENSMSSCGKDAILIDARYAEFRE